MQEITGFNRLILLYFDIPLQSAHAGPYRMQYRSIPCFALIA